MRRFLGHLLHCGDPASLPKVTIFEVLAKRKTLLALKINYLQGFVVPGAEAPLLLYIEVQIDLIA